MKRMQTSKHSQITVTYKWDKFLLHCTMNDFIEPKCCQLLAQAITFLAMYEIVIERIFLTELIEISIGNVLQVILMDVGIECDVDFNDLRRFRGVSARFTDMPPRVFECRLAQLQPSEFHSRYGWQSTMTEFKKLTSDTRISVDVTFKPFHLTTMSFQKIFSFADLLCRQWCRKRFSLRPRSYSAEHFDRRRICSCR